MQAQAERGAMGFERIDQRGSQQLGVAHFHGHYHLRVLCQRLAHGGQHQSKSGKQLALAGE